MTDDSCHFILFYMIQGVNSVLKDADVLNAILSQVIHVEHLSHAIKLYESFRKQRTQILHQITFQQNEELHLGDGSKQKKRDELLARSFKPISSTTDDDEEACDRWSVCFFLM